MNIDTRNRKRRSGAPGFTLIELLVVIAIIAMLAAIVGVKLSSQLDEGAVAAAKAQIKTFETALMAFKIKHKKFPQSLEELVSPPSGESFLNQNALPLDPWDNEYVYKLTGSSDYEIISYGADGSPGGSGYEADISSKNLQGAE